MDSAPRELSLAEIRSFMLRNNCKVTNHALVKHFRAFLTNKETQDEARKLFKSYVNTLASIKNDGAEKFLILRKKYVDECPSEDAVNLNIPMSPGSRSLTTVPSDGENSPFKNPPPYRPPPEVLDQVNPHPYQGSPRGSIALSRKNSSETCRSGSEYSFGSEFTGSDRKIGSAVVRSESGDSRLRSELARKQSVELYRFDSQEESAPAIPPRKRTSVDQTGGQLRQFSVEEKVSNPAKNVSVSASDSIESESNKENHIQQEEAAVVDGDGGAKPASSEQQLEENKLSVKEKMMKFNRFASEEEAKVPSPLGKKKPEKFSLLVY
ncbi:AAEL007504-PA [Aedes aegypti]|uniref:AAEL007504-PA n=1 Tax=Aedes aegypti TaxID=7159 RepID=Q171W9_AEDAE|nr:AAEL007504-PA [Aedes aegypti]